LRNSEKFISRYRWGTRSWANSFVPSCRRGFLLLLCVRSTVPIPTLNCRFVGFHVGQDLHRQRSRSRRRLGLIFGQFPEWSYSLERKEIAAAWQIAFSFLFALTFPSRSHFVQMSSVDSHAFIQSRCIISCDEHQNK